ncbi:MAG TPA: glycosyltransferase family 2 protein [Candidatus Lumbricidophila sp.]|nr:glycosyltransferase family 2 protein [Candidatus Lumbricidophila sp.]
MSAANIRRIGVALCTHNGAAHVEAQVRSILNQTRPVDELVVSDDASTDATIRLVEATVAAHVATGAQAPELKLLRNRLPLGVTANFEQALAATSSDVVALADQDDVWSPERVARALAELDAYPQAELVMSDARLIGGDGVDLRRTLFGTLGVDAALVDALRADPFEVLLHRNIVTGATVLLTRSLLERARPFPSAWVHDEWLAIVAAVGGGIAVCDAPLIEYRQHGANQIGVTKRTVSVLLERLRAPRTDRNARLLARATVMAERMPALAVGRARVLAAAYEKLDHERRRSALPARRIARLAPVLQIWRTGGYRNYGLGAQDALRDLVQPV